MSTLDHTGWVTLLQKDYTNIHHGCPWCWHRLNRSLKCSQASYSDSSSLWPKVVIWFLKLDILLGRKNFAKKTLVSSSLLVMHPGGKEWSDAVTLSLSEKGNSRYRIASIETLLSFNVSHISNNTERYKLGHSNGVPPNWNCCTMEMRANLSLKFWASTFGRAILEANPWTPEVTNSKASFFGHLLIPPSLKRLIELWLRAPLTSASSS